MNFEKYIGKSVLENCEDIVLNDVDIIEDDMDAVNVFFIPEVFEGEEQKQLKTGILVMYDMDRKVTEIISTAHIYEIGKPIVEADPETCEDEEAITSVLEAILY